MYIYPRCLTLTPNRRAPPPFARRAAPPFYFRSLLAMSSVVVVVVVIIAIAIEVGVVRHVRDGDLYGLARFNLQSCRADERAPDRCSR